MAIELNIGMNPSSTKPNARAFTVEQFVSAVALKFGTEYSIRVRVDVVGDEHTTVVRIDTDAIGHRPHEFAKFVTDVYQLADALDQDCIAVYFVGETEGTLIGLNAAAWGEFKRENFKRFF